MKTLGLYTAVVFLSCAFALGQAQYKILYSFAGPPDGKWPHAEVVFDSAGNLYGTTANGGDSSQCEDGCGTVFRLSPNQDGTWSETVLYDFCEEQNCADGQYPEAGLALDAAGNLYGVTLTGAVFELSPPVVPADPWTYKLLFQFGFHFGERAAPMGRMIFDDSGNLYGTTAWGGTGWGSVFELSPTPDGWTETDLYDFCPHPNVSACIDGNGPQAGVVFDKAGNLYGTTFFGGNPQYLGGGTVYRLSHKGGEWKETVLYAFPSQFGKRGGGPTGAVAFDANGNLFGTFSQGGESDRGGVFRLAGQNGGSEEIVSFDGVNGSFPQAAVLIDPRNNNLYGTATGNYPNYHGTVFRIAGKEITVLHTFAGYPTDGDLPFGALTSDGHGHLYGTTKIGGPYGFGTVFEITP